MRIPVIPLTVAAILMGIGAIVISFLPPARSFLIAPELNPILDVDGVETDVAIASDGIRYAIIASGDLWIADSESGKERRLTTTPQAESSPDWTPDGTGITFTREQDTYIIHPDLGEEALLVNSATELAWSHTGATAFVRGRGLWVGDSRGANATEIVPADANPDVAIHSPRFSPTGTQILFILSMLNLHGEVWVADTTTGDAIPIISDRNAENPTSAEWVLDNRHLAYVTDRGGGLAVWYVDLDESLLLPITPPLMGRSLAPLGIAVNGTRIAVPRHFVDSGIRTSDNRRLVDTDRLEFDPAVSRDGRHIAYTVENDSRFEIWVADADGGNPSYVALGRTPRFSPSGNEIVYARTDLHGNRDIWKVDVRSGLPEQLTDAPELDDRPDWSPDGRSIVFSSEWDGRVALWTIPASGGQRHRLNAGGYAPRFSPDGTRIAYWHEGALWIALADGTQAKLLAEAPTPVLAMWDEQRVVWTPDSRTVAPDRVELPFDVWPPFDRLTHDTWLVAALDVEKTELWSIDLIFGD